MGVARILAGALLVVGALSFAIPAAAEEAPQRYNCPTGFVWDPNSGTACVQEQYPPHGHIGYDGHPVCDEGYVGIYEQRPTTDGKGVPGNPATAFAYLLECVTPQEFADRQARVEGGRQLGDAASLLAESGTPLPPGQLILLGALGSGALIFAAVPQIRGRAPRKGIPAEPQQPSAGPGADEAEPPSDVESNVAELRERIATLDRIDKELAQKIDQYRSAAEAGRLTPQDVVTWAGIIADVASLIPVAQLPAGIASLGANVAGQIGEHYSTRDLDRAIREGLGAMAQLRGIIEVERAGSQAALEAAEQVGEAPVPQVPPQVLPDDTLRTERDRAHQAAVDAARRHVEATDALIDASERLREQQQRVRNLLEHLPDLDNPVSADQAKTANAMLDLAAGIDALTRYHQSLPQSESAARAAAEVLRVFRGEARGSFGKALDYAVDLGTEANKTKRAGKWAGGVSAASAGLSAYQWFASRSLEQRRVIVEQALEGLRYDQGRLVGRVQQAEAAMKRTQAAADAAEVRRRSLSKELDLRAARKGRLLWGE